jgi:hypothetical protein
VLALTLAQLSPTAHILRPALSYRNEQRMMQHYNTAICRDRIHSDVFIQTYLQSYIFQSNTPILFTKLCSQRHVSTGRSHHQVIHRTAPKISQTLVYILGSQTAYSKIGKLVMAGDVFEIFTLAYFGITFLLIHCLLK